MSVIPHVLVVGDVMRDVIVVPEAAMRHGSDINAQVRFAPGGSAANQARWLAAEKLDVTLVARVGLGDAEPLTLQFAAAGVDAVLVEDPDLATGALVSLSEPDGDRSFFSDRGANKNLSIKDVPTGAIAEADLLLLSGYMLFAESGRRTALSLIENARQVGTRVALDAASAGYILDVGVAAFLSWTRGIHTLFANEEEAALLSGSNVAEQQIEMLHGQFLQVVIKRGAHGAMARAADGKIIKGAAQPANCVDSTGAGDAFAAGFLSAHLTGLSLAEALDAGNRVASRAIAHLGGGPQVISRPG